MLPDPQHMTAAQLDELIDSTLASEPLRAAPLGMARRVEDRLRIAALMEQEQHRFRYSMGMTLLAFVGAIVATGWFVALTNLQTVIAYGMPGALGTYDYYATSMTYAWRGDTSFYTLGASVLLAIGTLLLGFMLPRRVTRAPH